jgi:hypothetical protein
VVGYARRVRSGLLKPRAALADHQRVHRKLAHFAVERRLEPVREQGLQHRPEFGSGEISVAFGLRGDVVDLHGLRRVPNFVALQVERLHDEADRIAAFESEPGSGRRIAGEDVPGPGIRADGGDLKSAGRRGLGKSCAGRE